MVLASEGKTTQWRQSEKNAIKGGKNSKEVAWAGNCGLNAERTAALVCVKFTCDNKSTRSDLSSSKYL